MGTPSAHQSCTQPQGIMDPILQDAQPVGQSMYCFSVYTKDTGSTKQSHELEILQHQQQQQLGIFQCEYSDVFSDVSVQVGQGLMTKVVTDQEGDWHFAKRKVSGTWVNTGMFSQIWKQISADGKYQNADWVLKVDADAIFVPNRMRVWFKQNELVPPAGIYLENCKYVDWGYFGNLEVFSRQAFQTLVDKVETCYTEIDWKTGIKGGIHGATGEDLFAQQCMDLMKVSKVENFALSMDGACEADRPADQRKNKKFVPDCNGVSTPSIHPFKKVEPYVKCWMAAKDVSN